MIQCAQCKSISETSLYCPSPAMFGLNTHIDNMTQKQKNTWLPVAWLKLCEKNTNTKLILSRAETNDPIGSPVYPVNGEYAWNTCLYTFNSTPLYQQPISTSNLPKDMQQTWTTLVDQESAQNPSLPKTAYLNPTWIPHINNHQQILQHFEEGYAQHPFLPITKIRQSKLAICHRYDKNKQDHPVQHVIIAVYKNNKIARNKIAVSITFGLNKSLTHQYQPYGYKVDKKHSTLQAIEHTLRDIPIPLNLDYSEAEKLIEFTPENQVSIKHLIIWVPKQEVIKTIESFDPEDTLHEYYDVLSRILLLRL